MEKYKVSDSEIKENGVQAVTGDVLYGEPSENKKLFDRLVTLLIGKYNSAMDYLFGTSHTHDNKELLDTIAEENVHAHDNKELLDTVVEENVHAHDNKEVLDTVVEENIHTHNNKEVLDMMQEGDFHNHDNKAVLDLITTSRANAWDKSAGIAVGSDYGLVSGIIKAANWNSETKTYSFEEDYPAGVYDIEVQPYDRCKIEQLDAWNDAMIVGSLNRNIIKAYGEIPLVDIPVIIKAIGNSGEEPGGERQFILQLGEDPDALYYAEVEEQENSIGNIVTDDRDLNSKNMSFEIL